MTFKVTFELPKFQVDEKQLTKILHKIGPKVATKTRKALKRGTDYDGDALPAGDQGKTIDLHESGTLLRSIKYTRRLAEVGAFGSHPTASERAGSCYGLMQILMSGAGRGGRAAPEVRHPFDMFGDRKRVFDDAADLFEEELNKLGDKIITTK